jgi:superfamily I DNA/RNA helicase
MWNWLELVLRRVAAPTQETRTTVTQEKMLSLLADDVRQSEESLKWGAQKLRTAHTRVIRSALKLCIAATLRISEQLNKEQQLIYRYSLGFERAKYVKQRIKNIIRIARRVSERLEKARQLSLTRLVACCGGRVSLGELKAALSLLSNLKLYANKQELTCYSYVLEVQNPQDSLRLPGSPDLSPKDQQMFDDLARVNKMAELRSYAMELYAFLPADYRKQYIDNYFSVGSPVELEELLEKTVGSVDDHIIQENKYLSALLAKVREEAIQDELVRLNKEQAAVCSFPYNQHLLVNAGPGSGKTHVLMMRCAHLINRQGLQPNEILVLAFNRAVVYEIKGRIAKLFAKLGYGSYVKNLHVYTFHAFAFKHMKPETSVIGNSDSLEKILHDFSLELQTDEDFSRKIASGYKAILVDEFQDMNEDFYNVLLALQKASGAGMMVIGDDDQDILLWNRLLWEEKYGDTPLHAFEYFRDLETHLQPQSVPLVENFRSGTEIVDRSQRMASRLINKFYRRLKEDIQLTAVNNNPALVEDVKSRKQIFQMVREAAQKKKNVAVLCRSNSQVFQVYDELQRGGMGNCITIQGDDGLKLSRLRDIGEWLDLCRKYLEEEEDPLLNSEILDEWLDRYNALGLPGGGNVQAIIDLWNFTQTEHRKARLSHHIEFVKDLDTADYTRISGKLGTRRPGVTISTIHKVKGLEFDTVFIMESGAPFPLSNKRLCQDLLPHFSAEEARLYYVAFTRAREAIYFQWGDRENCWFAGKQFVGTEGNRVLQGKVDEVYISWPGFEEQYSEDLQSYLLSEVAVQDDVHLKKNGSLKHKDRRIGKLAKPYRNGRGRLKVKAVYRYPVDESLSDNKPNIWRKIHPDLKEQGWLYTVLVSGKLERGRE